MTQVRETTEERRRTDGLELRLVVALEVAALLLWTAYDAADVELVARVGADVRPVGVAAVVLTTTLTTVAAIGLRWLLRGRARGLRTWSILAGAVWAVSFLGPLAAPDTASMLALASFHLVVGGGIFFGVRAIHGR